MRVWLGESVADLTNALRVLETCGDPTAESIARDLRRFVEDEDVADPPLECAGMGCGPTSACSPECEQEMCDQDARLDHLDWSLSVIAMRHAVEVDDYLRAAAPTPPVEPDHSDPACMCSDCHSERMT